MPLKTDFYPLAALEGVVMLTFALFYVISFPIALFITLVVLPIEAMAASIVARVWTFYVNLISMIIPTLLSASLRSSSDFLASLSSSTSPMEGDADTYRALHPSLSLSPFTVGLFLAMLSNIFSSLFPSLVYFITLPIRILSLLLENIVIPPFANSSLRVTSWLYGGVRLFVPRSWLTKLALSLSWVIRWTVTVLGYRSLAPDGKPYSFFGLWGKYYDRPFQNVASPTMKDLALICQLSYEDEAVFKYHVGLSCQLASQKKQLKSKIKKRRKTEADATLDTRSFIPITSIIEPGQFTEYPYYPTSPYVSLIEWNDTSQHIRVYVIRAPPPHRYVITAFSVDDPLRVGEWAINYGPSYNRRDTALLGEGTRGPRCHILECVLDVLGINGRADSRFLYREIEGEVDRHLNVIRSNWPATSTNQTTLYFVGHSLGGAVANVFSCIYLLRNQLSRSNHESARLFTIGQPRVGDSRFIEITNDVLRGKGNIVRVVNGNDMMPRLPPQMGTCLVHPSHLLYIDRAHGSLLHQSRLPDGTYFLDAEHPFDEEDTLAGCLWSHHPCEYVVNL